MVSVRDVGKIETVKETGKWLGPDLGEAEGDRLRNPRYHLVL